MSDHITDALVEQAARAGFGLECVDEAHAAALWNTCHESTEQYLRETRAALEAVVPAIVQAAKAEALEEAARRIEDDRTAVTAQSGTPERAWQLGHNKGLADAAAIVRDAKLREAGR